MLGLSLGITSSVLLRVAGSPYAEVGNIGYMTDNGNNATTPSSNEKASSVITVPVGGVWVKRAFISFGAGTAGLKFRPVLYSGSGASGDTLFQQGVEFVCPSTFVVTTELGPMPWQASGDAIFMPAGDYDMGAMFEITGMAIRNAGAGAGGLIKAADTYSDGAAATWGAVSGPFSAQLKMRIPYSLAGP